MNIHAFIAPHAGRIVTTPQGYAAFVPAPLPPALDLGMDLVRELSRADAALAGLSALGRQLPNPRLLVAPWLRREAVLSSRIEGTRATLSDVLIDELAGDTVPRDAAGDVREVRNYVEALEYGLGRLETLPLSLRLVSEQIAANPALIQYQYIQTLGPNVRLITIPSNSPFLFDLNSLMETGDPDFVAPAVPEMQPIVPEVTPAPLVTPTPAPGS